MRLPTTMARWSYQSCDMNSVEHCELTEIAARLGSETYHFVGSASFEARAFGIWDHLRSTIKGRKVICYNANHGAYLAEGLRRFAESDASLEIVKLDSDSPMATFTALRAMVDSLASGGPCRLVLDVTGFTREVVAMLIYLGQHRLVRGSTVKIVYQKAGGYGQTPVGGWLSQGVREVRTVLGYAGLVRLSAETHLILLGGFEFERAQEVVDALQPRRISLGRVAAENSVSVDLNDQLSSFLAKLEALYAGPAFDRIEFSSVDPFVTRDSILQHRRTSDDNIVIACMNTKLSMVGVCLAALTDQTLQLIYAQPLIYNVATYSKPSGKALLCTLAIEPGGR